MPPENTADSIWPFAMRKNDESELVTPLFRFMVMQRGKERGWRVPLDVSRGRVGCELLQVFALRSAGEGERREGVV